MIWTLSSSDNRDASYVDDLGIKFKKNNRNASAVMWLLPPSGRTRRSALGRGLPAPLNRSTQTEHKQKLIKRARTHKNAIFKFLYFNRLPLFFFSFSLPCRPVDDAGSTRSAAV